MQTATSEAAYQASERGRKGYPNLQRCLYFRTCNYQSQFPLQLWDTLTPQVITCLNMSRPSRIDPSLLANEIIHGLYNWNRYLLAPFGCKAVVYEDGDQQGLWVSRGVDGWYLGPSMDHYRCNKYHIPKTRAYCILGSTKLFPQHCQLPDLTPHQYC